MRSLKIEIRHVFDENYRVHRLRRVWRQLKPSIAEVQSAAEQCRADEISPSLVRRVRRPTHAMRQSLQFLNATPRKSPFRQISRHHLIVEKLSKVSSKVFGSTDRLCVRSFAPQSEMSMTLQPRAPVCPLKNRSAPFSMPALPTARRSL
jgi:hypothetical protein